MSVSLLVQIGAAFASVVLASHWAHTIYLSRKIGELTAQVTAQNGRVGRLEEDVKGIEARERDRRAGH